MLKYLFKNFVLGLAETLQATSLPTPKIFSPIHWIIGDIIFNVFKFLCITNNMVIKTGLPFKRIP